MEELSGALRQLGFDVRSQAIRTTHAGGVCRVRGRDTVLLNSRTSPLEQALVLADALATRDSETVILSEQARVFLSKRALRRKAAKQT